MLITAFTCWIIIITILCYYQFFRFPLSLWYPHKLQQSVEEYIIQFKGFEIVEKQVYKEAHHCLNMLENRLGNSKFFFGDSPSTFDAVLYGHLGVLLHAPLISTELQVGAGTTCTFN